MSEVWKPIKGYEGFYEVSDRGNVRSLDRKKAQMSSHGTMMEKRYPGIVLTPNDNGHGYKMVGLRDSTSGKKKNYYIHRLVAEAFIPNPNGLPVINHLDYDKGNNAASNLEWVTQIDNVHYSVGNMQKSRTKWKNTSTGEKYIFRKGGKYRLSIRNSRIQFDRRYATMEEAIRMREVILNDEKHLAG